MTRRVLALALALGLAGCGSGGGTTTATINLSAPPSFPYYDPLDVSMSSAIGTWPPPGNASPKKISAPIYTIYTLPPGATTCAGVATPPSVYLFPATDVPAKAIWNYVTLSNEGSGGIHNFPWTNQVIQASMSALGAWKP